jgi:hypothetical protein
MTRKDLKHLTKKNTAVLAKFKNNIILNDKIAESDQYERYEIFALKKSRDFLP